MAGQAGGGFFDELKRLGRWLKPLIKSAPVAEVRPAADSDAGLYAIVSLPPPHDRPARRWAFDGHPGSRIPRSSMSAYYYSGWREVFTVTIGTIAFFLFAYKITEKNLDNLPP